MTKPIVRVQAKGTVAGPRRPLPCVHLGGEKNTPLKTSHCVLYLECTRWGNSRGIRSCQTCESYSADLGDVDDRARGDLGK